MIDGTARRRTRKGTHACAFLVATLVAGTTEATSLRRMDLPGMARAADRIVHARAVEIRVSWDAAHRRIVTDTLFDVIASAKGNGPPRLTISLLGGRIDPYEMRAEGMPEFHVGEEVVLLTTPAPGGKHTIVGFSQGVFRIATDERSGARYLLTGEVSGAGDGPGSWPARARLPLESFFESLRTLTVRDVADSDRRAPRMRLLPAGTPAQVPR